MHTMMVFIKYCLCRSYRNIFLLQMILDIQHICIILQMVYLGGTPPIHLLNLFTRLICLYSLVVPSYHHLFKGVCNSNTSQLLHPFSQKDTSLACLGFLLLVFFHCLPLCPVKKQRPHPRSPQKFSRKIILRQPQLIQVQEIQQFAQIIWMWLPNYFQLEKQATAASLSGLLFRKKNTIPKEMAMAIVSLSLFPLCHIPSSVSNSWLVMFLEIIMSIRIEPE